MKTYIALLFIFISSLASAFVPIYDIQYTASPGQNDFYPSELEGNVVETGGIVTATDYSGGRYFISSPAGGAWNGLYIYDNEHNPQIGDELLLIGEVYEYYGFTELSNLSSYQVVSTNNPLPTPVDISCSEANSEAFESVFVQISDIQTSDGYNDWSQWEISDPAGTCTIGIGIYNLETLGFELPIDYPIASMRGVISFSYQEFLLHPRNLNDFTTNDEAYILSFDSQNIYNEAMLILPIKLSILAEVSNIQSLDFLLNYDEDILEFVSHSIAGSLLDDSGITIQSTPGNLELNYSGDATFDLVQTLLYLNFSIVGEGNVEVDFIEASVNNQTVDYLVAGEIEISQNSIEIGDTLSVIQRPILNIPEIITPNEEFEIWCIAPEETTNWQAELIYKDINYTLTINSADYDALFERWILNVSGDPFYEELYDLHVFADGEIDDISENAVRFITEEKSDFNFVHISDTHLPTHIFWSDNPEEALMDTTEVEDLRQVIKDINLINPEFVLLTGDVVNEGELEDFGNGRCYTKAQKILSEFQVPVYLVSGNHDLGGWDSTPPSQGTSRRDWWRFFGWKWLADVPEQSNQRTQDYSFQYGNNKFIGLEAYINYDSYMNEVFGGESFIPTQMQWLNLELANSDQFDNRILFYHYDFSDQLSLESMNIDMALYGHIHSNDGSINNSPYNLAVDSVCDETQAYRIINISDGELHPRESVYANWPEDNLSIAFTEDYSGSNLTITATITNQHDLDFTDCALRYDYPTNITNFIASEGYIKHIINMDDHNEFLLLFDIEANSEKQITITSSLSAEDEIPVNHNLITYPNPLFLSGTEQNNQITFSFSNPKVSQNAKIAIYNIKGQCIDEIIFETEKNKTNQVVWDGTDYSGKTVSTGIYFSKLIINNRMTASKKIMVIK